MRPVQDIHDIIRNLLKDISHKYNIPLHELYAEYGVSHGERKPLPYKRPTPVVLKPIPLSSSPDTSLQKPTPPPHPPRQGGESKNVEPEPPAERSVTTPKYDGQKTISQENLNMFFNVNKSNL